MRTSEQIERLVEQWRPERPDLDLGAMASVARLMALAQRIQGSLDELAAAYGVQVPEADLLFTLRRAGPPYRLTPTTLSEALLVSSGTLTSRLDRLERKRLIQRVPHPSDRRSMEVQLTDAGRELVDEAVTVHVDNERRMLAGLSERERGQLDSLVAKLLDHLAEEAEQTSTGRSHESAAGKAEQASGARAAGKRGRGGTSHAAER